MDKLKILMLEDNELDALVIQKQIKNGGIDAELKIVKSGTDYEGQLQLQSWDLILCDHQTPDYNSIKALKAKNDKQPRVPFILITGAVPENEAVELVRGGADDYILKDRLNRLPIAINKIIEWNRFQSEKKLIEVSFSELTERFQLATRASFDVIWDYDLDENIVYCSPAIEGIIGLPLYAYYKPEFLAQFIYKEDLPHILRSFQLLLSGSEHKWRKIFRVTKINGDVAWINTNALLIRNENEKVCRVVGVMQDVTELRQLQHQLMEQENIKQKEIASVAIEVQEKEREEIGRELHDNVNQLLATAKIMIDTARSIPDMREKCLLKSQDTIMKAIHELRNISHSMMPPILDNRDFYLVIDDLVNNLNLTGNIHVEVDLPSEEVMGILGKEIKLAFYRIIQVQISNVLKHSKAKNVAIAIKYNENSFTLTIADDGKGFDSKKKGRGIGFRNIAGRIKMFDGQMKVISSPGEGCLLSVQIPVRKVNGKSGDKKFDGVPIK